ncbi:DUF6297 family protein [Glutamicibacter sp.]|uniref:DUF6297 family protein n=1 Tax=Glutamicibacter sp. TaxID=1931995 RepID=UPI0028BEC350|nr:DUF6297 family protein [Glutamicibacter sp.]
MNANSAVRGHTTFDPASVLRRARAKRSFSERIDEFSDAYVWALAAVVALTYLSSALYGAIFVLLGEGVPHISLPTAVWNLEGLSIVLLPVVLIAIFRFQLLLGPLGIVQEKAEWWLPLPIQRRVLLRPMGVRAIGMGICSSLFLGLLWILVFSGGNGGLPGETIALATLFFGVMGLGLAGLAVVIQINEHQRFARGAGNIAVLAITGVFAVLTVFQLDQSSKPPIVLETAGSYLSDQIPWLILLLAAVVLSLVGINYLLKHGTRVSGASLRRGGIRQQQVAGLMMQADARAIARRHHASSTVHTISHRLTAKLPAIQRVILLRYLRAGLWRPAAIVGIAGLAMMLLVQDVANPLAACLLLAVLLGVLNTNLSTTILPLATQRELGNLLGRTPSQADRAALSFGAVTTAGWLLLWALGLRSIGFFEESAWWTVLLGLVMTSLGLASSALDHAQRGEREWGALFSNATNEMTMSAFLIQEMMTLIRALAAGAVFYFIILAPAAPVPWGIWGISVLCALPGVRKFF